jgi:hypothetical protein
VLTCDSYDFCDCCDFEMDSFLENDTLCGGGCKNSLEFFTFKFQVPRGIRLRRVGGFSALIVLLLR